MVKKIWKEQDSAIRAIDNMLNSLNKPIEVSKEDIVKFYNNLEEDYDESMKCLKEVLLDDITDSKKLPGIKAVSVLLESNII